jgi:YVTN family beta-propeller protein
MMVVLNSSVRWRGLLGLAAVLFAGACLPAVASARRLPAADYLAYVTEGSRGTRLVPPGPGSVAVIDPATRQVVARIPVGSRPDAVQVSPDGKRVYVAHDRPWTISVIDTASDEVTATIRLNEPTPAFVISPDGRSLYVAGGDQVTVLDTSTDAVVKTIQFRRSPWALTFSPDGKRLYVASTGAPAYERQWGSLTTIDVADNSVLHTTPLHPGATAVAAPTDTKAYVITGAEEKGIKVVDTVTGKLTGAIAGDYEEVEKIALSPDRARAYVAGDRGLEVIDTATDHILRTVHFGSYIRSLAVSPNGRELYVILGTSDEIKVLDTASLRVLGEIPAGSLPHAMAFSPVAAPRVVTEPTNQSLVYGGEAHLFAQATGDPTPAVQWQVSRDGGGSWHDLAGATVLRHAFVPSGARSGDEYRAEFTNHGGSVATQPATLTVVRAVPTLEWQVPTPIAHGTPLSPDELDAEASVPGTFHYTPLAGTVLAVGAGQHLSVTFTPRAGENYTSVTTSVPIDVTTAPERPQPSPPPPPPAPVIPTPQPLGPTNPTPTPPGRRNPTPASSGPTKPAAPKVCAVNSRLVVIVPSRLRPRATQLASAVVVNARGSQVRRASHQGWRVTVSLRGLSGGSYSLRILIRGTTSRAGANGSRPASRTLRADISGCRQSGSMRLVAKGR